MTPDAILRFWFEETPPKAWWTVDAKFDRMLAARFGDLLCRAAAGELYAWREDARGWLAEIIVLDQFSRNIHRDTARAFAQDAGLEFLKVCQPIHRRPPSSGPCR